jgi:glycosyltransferase involved in cell wall biosynthesis
MPIYNGIEFLEESYNSLLSQTFDKWELLIGINGHEKNSIVYNTAKNITSNNSKAKIYDFDNIKGKSNTLNELVKLCNNNILCLLDVDDVWHPKKLEKQIHLIESCDVIGTDCIYFGDRNDKPVLPFGHLNPDVFYYVNPIINSSSMFKKEDAFWDSNLDGIEDYDMWLRLNKQKKSFFNINEELCYHRIHKASSFNTKNYDAVIEQIRRKYK